MNVVKKTIDMLRGTIEMDRKEKEKARGRNINDISGATILGDGTVTLILDTNVLLEKVDKSINY